MIFIGVGANLPSPSYGSPLETCKAAVEIMDRSGLRVKRRSRWILSAPVPASDQPWYVNCVVEVETTATPGATMDLLHDVEAQCGRVRIKANAARTIDLDLLAFHDIVLNGDNPDSITLPHPRMHERAFVLAPLAELSPNWTHPITGKSVQYLIASLPTDQEVKMLDDARP